MERPLQEFHQNLARLLPRDLVSRIDAASDICVLVYFDVFGPALSGPLVVDELGGSPVTELAQLQNALGARRKVSR